LYRKTTVLGPAYQSSVNVYSPALVGTHCAYTWNVQRTIRPLQTAEFHDAATETVTLEKCARR